MKHFLGAFLVSIIVLGSTTARAAEGTVSFEVMKPQTALNAAQAALEHCRGMGFQVGVAVVDRFGGVQVALRDQLAGARTINTA
ncbi:MAG TPA: heme-binding protein, partial [Gammaproteobacteria bacterium]|nr:heme-binding protein [Gammaproteobacteria bacterium]